MLTKLTRRLVVAAAMAWFVAGTALVFTAPAQAKAPEAKCLIWYWQDGWHCWPG